MQPAPRVQHQGPIVRLLKNATGGLFLIAGIAMLVLPGQGLLTILIGLMLIDFPGKRRFELALIRRRHVLNAVNWMRQKSGRDPLLVSNEADEATDRSHRS